PLAHHFSSRSITRNGCNVICLFIHQYYPFCLVETRTVTDDADYLGLVNALLAKIDSIIRIRVQFASR
ncbi:MAG TPA: hypothetical protein VGB38_04995, partial [bacterium]